MDDVKNSGPVLLLYLCNIYVFYVFLCAIYVLAKCHYKDETRQSEVGTYVHMAFEASRNWSLEIR
jgi:hypothetical protein